MRVLLLCDDRFHPGSVPAAGLAPLQEKGIQFDVIQDAGKFDPANLKNYPVVIISKSDHTSSQDHTPWKTAAIQDAFIQYVENGGGLIVNHSGTVRGEGTDKLDRLAGCRFLHHPPTCPVWVQPLKPHPVTQGVEAFMEDDEHYYVEILAPDADILAAAYAPGFANEDGTPGSITAAACVRTQGKGRVCVLTPGHTPAAWANPNYQQMVLNAINWCAGK